MYQAVNKPGLSSTPIAVPWVSGRDVVRRPLDELHTRLNQLTSAQAIHGFVNDFARANNVEASPPYLEPISPDAPSHPLPETYVHREAQIRLQFEPHLASRHIGFQRFGHVLVWSTRESSPDYLAGMTYVSQCSSIASDLVLSITSCQPFHGHLLSDVLLSRFNFIASCIDTPDVQRILNPASSACKALSPREIQVLRLSSKGASAADVAQALSISLRTVAAHVETACRKLGVTRKTAAVLIAERLGLLS
jgi:DNA-binding CsgD family transcriptional regulator